MNGDRLGNAQEAADATRSDVRAFVRVGSPIALAVLIMFMLGSHFP